MADKKEKKPAGAKDKALEVKNVSKALAGSMVIDDLSFTVRGGETFGLLGPNGAGKTTMMRMIMNIIRPDEGEIVFDGNERGKIKAIHFGYLPEERGLYPYATVLDTLIYFGTLNDLSKRKAEVEAIRYLDRLGLVDFTDSKVNTLSKGMQQKIQFISAFLHDPDVLILDEPFSGLDPINQIVLRDILREYKEKRKILIISTHMMDVAEKMCDHICLMNRGRTVLDGRIADIKKKYREDAYFLDADDTLAFLQSHSGVEVLEEYNTAYKFRFIDPKIDVADFLKNAGSKIRIRRFEVVEPSLHDIFMDIIHNSGGAENSVQK